MKILSRYELPDRRAIRGLIAAMSDVSNWAAKDLAGSPGLTAFSFCTFSFPCSARSSTVTLSSIALQPQQLTFKVTLGPPLGSRTPPDPAVIEYMMDPEGTWGRRAADIFAVSIRDPRVQFIMSVDENSVCDASRCQVRRAWVEEASGPHPAALPFVVGVRIPARYFLRDASRFQH